MALHAQSKKRCPICKEIKSHSAFGWRLNGGTNAYCRECNRTQAREKWRAKKGLGLKYRV
jgi:hypothetical protein